jgi:hypothetical protein
MIRRMPSLLALSLATLIPALSPARAQQPVRWTVDSLDPARRDSLLQGYTTILSRESGARLVAFRLVKVRPLDAAAALVNFAAQPGYVPYVKEAAPHPGAAPATVDVDYTVEAPVHDVSYSVRDSVSRTVSGEYFLGWRLLRSAFLGTVSGGASARSWRGDTTTTLLVYDASARAKWFLQWLSRLLQGDEGVRRLRETVDALASHIESETPIVRADERARLTRMLIRP